MKNLQVITTYLKKISNSQKEDEICAKLRDYTINGWPNRKDLPLDLRSYYEHRFDFSLFDDLLLKDIRIVIPKTLQKEVLEFIHTGHQGIVKCKRRASTSVWWISSNKQIEDIVTGCRTCIEHRSNRKEPYFEDDFPERPWEKLAADLFKSKRNGKWYLIVTDYFS